MQPDGNDLAQMTWTTSQQTFRASILSLQQGCPVASADFAAGALTAGGPSGSSDLCHVMRLGSAIRNSPFASAGVARALLPTCKLAPLGRLAWWQFLCKHDTSHVIRWKLACAAHPSQIVEAVAAKARLPTWKTAQLGLVLFPAATFETPFSHVLRSPCADC